MEKMILLVTGTKASEVKSAISKILDEAQRMHLEVLTKPKNEKIGRTQRHWGVKASHLLRKSAILRGEISVIQSLRYINLTKGVYFALVPLKRDR